METLNLNSCWTQHISFLAFHSRAHLLFQVDFSGMVGDEFLESLGLEKGVRRIINHEDRGKVLRALHGSSFKASAGGSLSNTLVALARLGTTKDKIPRIAVAMTGSVGSDPLGDFYRYVQNAFFPHILYGVVLPKYFSQCIECVDPLLLCGQGQAP